MKTKGIVTQDIYYRDLIKNKNNCLNNDICFFKGKELTIHGYFMEGDSGYYVVEANKGFVFTVKKEFIQSEGELIDLGNFDCGLPIMIGTTLIEESDIYYGPYNDNSVGKIYAGCKAILIGTYSRFDKDDEYQLFFPSCNIVKGLLSKWFKPISDDESKRISIIKKLKKLDRNGVWSDNDCYMEGIDFLTLEEAEKYLLKLSNPE